MKVTLKDTSQLAGLKFNQSGLYIGGVLVDASGIYVPVGLPVYPSHVHVPVLHVWKELRTYIFCSPTDADSFISLPHYI